MPFGHPPGDRFPLGPEPFFDARQDLRGRLVPSEGDLPAETVVQPACCGGIDNRERDDHDQDKGHHSTSVEYDM